AKGGGPKCILDFLHNITNLLWQRLPTYGQRNASQESKSEELQESSVFCFINNILLELKSLWPCRTVGSRLFSPLAHVGHYSLLGRLRQ
ncbi:hypothetical protein AVEN_40330-1, partial [Araneus ventricosus]